MTLRRLTVLEWTGLFLGAAVFALAHLSGYSIALAECGPARAAFGIDHRVWEGAALSSAAALALVAEAAAITVLRSTTHERLRFFAICAAAANILFFTICILDLAAELSLAVCRGA